MLRRTLILLPVALFLSACFFDAPKIDVITQHDLGIIAKGQIAQASFSVRNTGSAPLEIQSVSTSCGCTKASVTPRTIPAGGEGILEVAYDSGAHEADMGKITRLVFLHTNDPDKDSVRIQLDVQIRKP